jgi:RNA polymerase sigma-70 factor (ECF subfamily)
MVVCHSQTLLLGRHAGATVFGPSQVRHEDWEEMAIALERIPREHETILRLRYFASLSYREIAENLNIPHGTVMSRLHYARKALAAEMERITP